MAFVDMPLAELKQYNPPLTMADDFDAFWTAAKQESDQVPLQVSMNKIADYPVKSVALFDITFSGMDGTPVHGSLMMPVGTHPPGSLPAIIHYHGYSMYREFPHQMLPWVAMNMVVLSIDVRGQGGNTPDAGQYDQGHAIGHMTKSVLDPHTYYYRQVYMDCVRAIDVVCQLDAVNEERVVVAGASQGGGLTLAAASIDHRPKLALPVFPFLCHFRRAMELYTEGPYEEIRQWFRRYDPAHELEDTVFRTLSYFDGMNHATRVKAKTLMAITLQDTICPPSTCYAAYNHLASEKSVIVYPYFGHEGLPWHQEKMMQFVSDNL